MGALKEILEDAAIHSISTSLKKTGKLVQIESTKRYIEALKIARTAWLSILATQIFLFLAVLSFLGALGAGLFLIPFDSHTRLWIVFGLSLFISTASLIGFVHLNSEKKWLEFSKANELISKILYDRCT